MSLADCLLHNGRFVLPRTVLAGGAVAVRAGRIDGIFEQGDTLPSDLPRRDLGGALVSPGLVEFHIHGVDGIRFDGLSRDTEDRVAPRHRSEGTASSAGDPAETLESLLRAREALRRRGVTCFLPTLVRRDESIEALVAAIEAAGLSETELPGIYLEGPFISPRRAGRIPAESICDPDTRQLGHLINLAHGRIRVMTLAPELPGSREIVARLSAVGVLPSFGHSDCALDRLTLPEGKFSLTHLFNAMSPFSHREEGLAMLPFLDRRPFVEIVADGRRVNEAALRICASAVDPERLMLVSDAERSVPDLSHPAPPGYLLGAELLRNWMRVTGASIPNAVRMLSLTPSQALGMDDRRGAIAVGLDADLVVWDGDFESVREILG
ncbi:MAG: N-acetylglucosamine-6-phosphate deacetylase [Rectinemataceae bacterium]